MPAGTADREATPRGSATRRQILRVTFDLVGREGIGVLSNRRIAAEAGVSLGSLTYHFPSQAELLHECLELYAEEEVARLEKIAADMRDRCPSPEEIAVEVQRLVAEGGGRPESLAELELHLHAARDPALREASRRCFDAYEGLAATVLRALEIPEADRHARAVVAVMFGMGIQRYAGGRIDAAGLVGALQTIVSGARAESMTPSSDKG